MAEVTRCEWISPGPVSKLVRHVAIDYTLAVKGERGRKVFSASTSQEDSLMALTGRQQQIRAGQTGGALNVTLDARQGLA